MSSPLSPGKTCCVRLRAASVIGDKFYVEEKEILLRAGEVTQVTFDVTTAQVVPLTQIIEPMPPAK